MEIVGGGGHGRLLLAYLVVGLELDVELFGASPVAVELEYVHGQLFDNHRAYAVAIAGAGATFCFFYKQQQHFKPTCNYISKYACGIKPLLLLLLLLLSLHASLTLTTNDDDDDNALTGDGSGATEVAAAVGEDSDREMWIGSEVTGLAILPAAAAAAAAAAAGASDCRLGVL